jgi:hypothetical protein
VFGLRRRREAAAAEAAKDAERRALFAQLAQRPANICPFLGLAYERTAYVDGPSIEHRCFAFGDPAPLSTEQQTRVCQERGYGHCPRYLRGLLVTPTAELEALRTVRPSAAPFVPPSVAAGPVQTGPVFRPDQTPRRRRRRALVVAALLVVLIVAIGVAYLVLFPGARASLAPSATPTPTIAATASESPAPTAAPTSTPRATPSSSGLDSPTPEPTPEAGDRFAFYEVSVSPGSYLLFDVDDQGNVDGQRRASFDEFSFAQVEPIEGPDGDLYWRTVDGGLAGLAYLSPDSGDFRIRAVFLDGVGSRRSVFLEGDELTTPPSATPAP